MRTSGFNELKLIRALVTGGLLAASVILGYFAISQGNFVIGLLIPLIALVSFFIGRPALLLIAVFFINYARFKIPGLPSALGVLQLSQVLLIGWAVLDISIVKQKHFFSYNRSPDIWLIVFGINLFLLMAVRGVGFAKTGGAVYGGAEYIAMVLTLLFYFAAVRMEWNDLHVKKLLVSLLIGASIPMFTQAALYLFEGGAFYLLKFIDIGTAMGFLEEKYGEEGTVRWGTFSQFAYMLIPIAYIFCKNNKWRVLLLLLAFILVGLTGFRSRMVTVGALVFMTSIYYAKYRIRALVFWALAGVMILGLLMMVTPELPRPIQRTLSFIPFLPVDIAVAERAANSGTWRIDLWRDYCLPNVPKYLLVGRGLSPDISSYAWVQAKWYTSGEFYYYMGRYHSGPFSLLLDFGLLGTVSFTAFFLISIADAWRNTRRYAAKRNTLAAKYYVYLTLLLTYEVFSFYFIFGDVRGGLFRLLMIAIQLRVLKKNFLMESLPEAGVTRSREAGIKHQGTARRLNNGQRTIAFR